MHTHVLFVVFLSVIVHTTLPGGACNDAVPAFALPSNLINTRRSVATCSSVIRLPFLVILPVPVIFVAPQQN